MNNKEISVKNNRKSKMQENQNLSDNHDVEKLKDYQQRLESFHQKIRTKKRKFNFLLKESLSKLASQESEIQSQLNTLTDRMEKVKTQKEASDQQISQQKYLLIKLEDEKNKLSKTNLWAETTFSNSFSQNSSTAARDSIFELLAELDQIKVKSQSLRSKIFLYQKELLKLSDAISPITMRIYFLQAKLDYEKENELNNHELTNEKKNTISAAVTEQHLKIEEMKLKKRKNEIEQKIAEIKDEKNQIMKKLAFFKSTDKETLLKTILEQVNQYQEASLRRKNYQENEFLSVHDSISKELEIKIEIDEVQNELNEVKRQKEEIKNNLIQKKTEINSLQNILVTSNIQDLPKDPLHELILQIKRLRDEGNKIAQQTPREFTIDQSELLQVRQNFEFQYNQLKLIIEQQLNFNKQMKKEIIKRENEFNNNKNQKQNQQDKVFIPDTPKINLLKKRINDIENEISNYHQKTQKKLIKISKKKADFDNNLQKLDLNTNQNFLKAEFANRFKGSMNWFLQTIRSQIKIWFSQSIDIPRIIEKWDSQIISAVINETEDFILKSSILCK